MNKKRFDPGIGRASRQWIVLMGVNLPPENTLVWQECASEDNKAAANREMERIMLERSDVKPYPTAREKQVALTNYDGPALVIVERTEQVVRSVGFLTDYDG